MHTAWEQEGVLGARKTGAGFGGCAIALVNKDKVEVPLKKLPANAMKKSLAMRLALYCRSCGRDTSFRLR